MSRNRATSLLAACALGLLALGAGSAQATPAWEQIKPDKGYGKVVIASAVQETVAPYGKLCKYQFTVINPVDGQAVRGIKGLVIYSPVAPVLQNDRPDTIEFLYHNQHEYSRWEIKGRPDRSTPAADDKVLLDEGESKSDFFLWYPADKCPRACDLKFAIKVVGPTHNGGAWFQVGPGNVQCPPCATLTGKVTCPSGQAISGATVQLLSGGTVLQTVTSGAGGAFAFDAENLPAANYTVAVNAGPDFQPTPATQPFYYHCDGQDVQVSVTATPKALKPLCEEKLCGSVFFANDAIYRRLAVAGVTLSAADLTNPAYASGPLAGTPYRSYRYSGPVPKFPGLSGASQVIYVIIEDPLVADEGKWNNCSFTNQVGVAKNLLGTGPSTAFTYRTNFNFGFAPDSGTAYNFGLDGFAFGTAGNLQNVPTTVLPLVKLDGTAPMAFAGPVPPGYLFRAQFQFDLGQGATTMVWGIGRFANICGDPSRFECHPPMGGGPQ